VIRKIVLVVHPWKKSLGNTDLGFLSIGRKSAVALRFIRTLHESLRKSDFLGEAIQLLGSRNVCSPT
jgi:hypothetical protein